MQVYGGSSDLAIKLAVNGAAQAITVDVRTSLLDLLREVGCRMSSPWYQQQ